MALSFLKSFFILFIALGVNLLSFAPYLYAKPSAKQAYLYAQKLLDQKQPVKAYALLKNHFALGSRKTPVAIISLASQAALEAGQVGVAERISEKALKQHFSWWSSFVKNPDRANIDLYPRLEKMHKGHLHLFWMAGKSKSLLYKDFYTKINPRERKRLKNETQAVYDVLIQSSFDSEKTEEFFNNLSKRDTLEVKKVFGIKRRLSLRSIFWSDEFNYVFENDLDVSGDAIAQAFCVGGSYSYENLIVQFILNGCAGMGTSNLQLSSGFYNNVGTRVVILGAGIYKKLNNLRVDVGVDFSAFVRFYELRKISTAPEPVSFSSQTSLMIAPAVKFNFGKFQFNLKAGKQIGVDSEVWLPSVWMLEATHPF